MTTIAVKTPKMYATVKADFDEVGTLLLRIIAWEDGIIFAEL